MTRTRILISSDAPKGTKTFLESLAADGLPADALVIYRGRNTVAVTPDRTLCIKAFKINGAVKSFIYGRLRTPKAERAFDNASRLRAEGFDTPSPIGAALNYDGTALTSSYYICRYAPEYAEMRDVEKRTDFDALAEALAAYMLRLHRAGILMKDFTPGNVLFRRDADGTYRFILVDINRMEFGVTAPRRLHSNFKALLNTPAGVDIVARHYARLSEAPDPEKLVDKLNGIYAAHQAFLRRKRKLKQRLKKTNA